MQDSALLSVRIGDLGREIRALERALTNAAIEPALRERVWRRFETEIRKHRSSSTDLQRDLAAGGAADQLWPRLRTCRADLNLLVREFLAFLHGALVRGAGVDAGLCTIADALLDDLSRRSGIEWRGFTVLASEDESYVDLAELVRLRFPAVTIWSLPVAVHEFGHFVGPLLSERLADGQRYYRFREYHAKAAVDDPRKARHVHEQFADAFAAYTLGPAYACTCVMLRFDPSEAFVAGARHPSPNSRISSILELLETLDSRRRIARLYATTITSLRETWQMAVAVSTHESSAASADSMSTRSAELLDLLERLLPGDAQYAGWRRAERLAPLLEPDTSSEPGLEADDTLLDVLNAAWICRLRDPGMDPTSLRIIEERATSLCDQILRD